MKASRFFVFLRKRKKKKEKSGKNSLAKSSWYKKDEQKSRKNGAGAKDREYL